MIKNFEKYAVIIPAYNEKKNLQLLIQRIIKNYKGIFTYVVDDSDISNRFKSKSFRVKILYREVKSGRGSAVLFGLASAYKNYKVKYFIEMDADLAHNPDEIKNFFPKKDFDLVIGSRYIAGSNITNWPLKRLIQSRIINFILHYWLGLKISDYTNGFRMYSRSAVKILINTKLYEKGFINLSETAYVIRKNMGKITEIPITFQDRMLGRSNANFGELMSSLVGAIRIPFKHK